MSLYSNTARTPLEAQHTVEPATVVRRMQLRRHAHSDWQCTPPEERDRRATAPSYRFLKKHGQRKDLLLAHAGKR